MAKLHRVDRPQNGLDPALTPPDTTNAYRIARILLGCADIADMLDYRAARSLSRA